MELLLLDALLSSTLWISHLWSMLFACLLLFLLFFLFLFSSHFCLDRLFGFSIHRGINSFQMPLFLPELPLKVVNSSGCSFLLKLPFRVFNLASSFIFIFILFFHSCHRPQIVLGREPAGNLHQNGYRCPFVHVCFV